MTTAMITVMTMTMTTGTGRTTIITIMRPSRSPLMAAMSCSLVVLAVGACSTSTRPAAWPAT